MTPNLAYIWSRYWTTHTLQDAVFMKPFSRNTIGIVRVFPFLFPSVLSSMIRARLQHASSFNSVQYPNMSTSLLSHASQFHLDQNSIDQIGVLIRTHDKDTALITYPIFCRAVGVYVVHRFLEIIPFGRHDGTFCKLDTRRSQSAVFWGAREKKSIFHCVPSLFHPLSTAISLIKGPITYPFSHLHFSWKSPAEQP